ncbi:MAG: carbohydrate porin [Bacteroidota bacterium]
MKYTFILFFLFIFEEATFGQNKNWSLHFQQTVIPQHKLKINAPYSGDFSLSDSAETQTSLTTTIYLGRRLWKGAAVFYNPELAGGSGLSQARGIAGFTNGECFRIGNPTPTIYTARLFLRQDFALSGEKTIESTKKSKDVRGENHAYPVEREDDEANSIGGERPVNRFTIALGKFSIADYFDNNAYAHDPRSQFMNWALMSTGGWDYPANTRGYTWNAVLEYVHERWAIRAGTSLVPTTANGPDLNWQWNGNNSNTLELEKSTTFFGKEGKLRALAFYTTTYMGSYAEAIKQTNPDVTLTRKNGRTKYGFGINYEQELSNESGLFLRASWNDGNNETWAFTEIDHSVSGGFVKDNLFGRKQDRLNIGFAFNGISDLHRQYLAKGGYGFIIGDGKLPNYGLETILEINYNVKVTDWLSVTPDYQLVINPAYNQDRGPVHAFALRMHTEF